MYRVASKRHSTTQTPLPPNADRRTHVARALLTAGAALLIVRLFTLQVVDARFYTNLASEQRDTFKELFPERGEILLHDRATGTLTPLATNKDMYLVYADPRLVVNPEKTAKALAPLLGIEKKEPVIAIRQLAEKQSRVQGEEIATATDGGLAMTGGVDEYQKLVEHLSKKNDPYEPLKPGMEQSVADAIKKLSLPGIDTVRQPVRYYPLNNISSHIAGFFGSDGTSLAGRYGLEGAFNKELAGEQGYFEGEKDVAGRWIPVGRRTLKPAIDGSTLVLTIDRSIQYTACTKLDEAVAKHSATGGSVVIMEVATGKILAMCGAPDFNPNEYSKVKDAYVYNNPATFGQYEPGSVFKAITMASALDTGEVTPETTYEDTGEVKFGSHTIQNSDHKAHGVRTMTQVLEESLNTGAIFAAQKVGSARFLDYVKRFGLGTRTGIELGSEAKGDISSLSQHGEIYLATGSFGQGISVTPIQLVQAFGAIANQGTMMKPYLIEEIRHSNGATETHTPVTVREVITPRTATLLSGMLASVVERGHGKRAGVPGYYVGGKTGTAQIPRADGKGYEEGPTIGTFVGFAPLNNPKFVMLTRIDRPKDVQFAESSAAPLFGELAKFLLQYFEIKPTRAIK